MTEWREGRDGRSEWWATQECWVVYCPSPGQSSGPRKVRQVRAGGFIATSAGAADVCGPYASRAEAETAARGDAEGSGYPDTTVIYG